MDFNQLNEFITNHSLLFMALLAIIALLVGGELRHRLSKVIQVAPAEATRLLNHEDAIMVDMRTDKDFRDGHIVNAMHVPADNAGNALKKYISRPLIIYCRNGQQSNQLAGKLIKQGFSAVYNLKGGILAWQQADLPLSKGK